MDKINKANTENRIKQPHSALCFAPFFDYRWLRTRRQNAEKRREKSAQKSLNSPLWTWDKIECSGGLSARERSREKWKKNEEKKWRRREGKIGKEDERKKKKKKFSLIKGTRCGRGVRPPHCPLTEPDQNALRRKEESKRELRMREKSEMGGFIKR